MPLTKYLYASLFLVLMTCQMAAAQRREVGGGIGVAHYKGELAPNYHVLNGRPGAMIYYRNNLSSAFTMKFSLAFMSLSGNDSHYPGSPMAKSRQASFSGTLAEISLQGELNFLDLTHPDIKKMVVRYSPYFLFGLSAYSYTSPGVGAVPTSMAIPLGIGVKKVFAQTWMLGLEIGARKTFTDKLDGVYQNLPGQPQTAITTDTDWYMFSCLTLGYTFYKVVCANHLTGPML